MDILVLLAEPDDRVDDTTVTAVPIAHVRSAPDASRFDAGFGRGAREVVTLYGVAEPERLAVAIAAAFEGRRGAEFPVDAVRRFGVWADRGAVGDVAWRDRSTGQLVTREMRISAAAIADTARRVLVEHGRAIRQTIAGLAMSDWPEGMRRAIQVSVAHVDELYAAVGAHDALLASIREADGYDDGYGDGYDNAGP